MSSSRPSIAGSVPPVNSRTACLCRHYVKLRATRTFAANTLKLRPTASGGHPRERSRGFVITKESLYRHEISFKVRAIGQYSIEPLWSHHTSSRSLMSLHDHSSPHICAELSEGDWRRHCPSLAVLKLSDKTVIHHQGDACDDVFVVVKGRVKLLRLNHDGDQFVMAVLTEGQWFGAALTDRSSTTITDTAEAKGRTVLYRIPLKEMRTLLTRDGDFAWHALDAQATEIHALRRKLELMRFHDVRSRLTETLRDLAGSHGGHCRHGFELDIKLTQQELADLVGASRPVVSTLLNDLKSHGVLDYHRTLICIQDLAALK